MVMRRSLSGVLSLPPKDPKPESCSRYAYSLMSASVQANHSPEFWPMNWPLPDGIHAVCTTRVGGVSQPPFGSWNLGDHVRDDPLAVAQNRALLQEQLGGAKPIFLSQVHGTDVVALTSQTPDSLVADACLSVDSQLACTIMVADCLPLMFTDDHGRVVAAAHAGWRGLAAGVIEKTVDVLTTRWADPRALKQGIKRYPSVYRFIRPLLAANPGVVVTLVRS